MDDGKLLGGVLVCLMLSIVTTEVSVMLIGDWHMHRMAELGYEQRMVVGDYNPVWQKAAQPVVQCDCNCPRIAPASTNIVAGATNWCEQTVGDYIKRHLWE